MQVSIGGLTNGAIYALILLGILLAYQVSKAVNFAHGQLGMLAAFGAYFLYERHGFPVWFALLLGVAAAAMTGAFTEMALLRRLPSNLNGFDLVMTLGVLLILTSVAENVFGDSTYSFVDLFNRNSATVGGVYLNGSDLLVIGTTAVALVVTYVTLKRTRVGVNLRAAAESPLIARSVGINVNAIRALTWAVSGVLAAVAGVLVASRLSVDAFYMTPFLIKAFTAGIIGGLDRFTAPLAAAFALGVYENWVAFVFGSDVQTPAVFILIIVLLSFAPREFLEERREGRA